MLDCLRQIPPVISMPPSLRWVLTRAFASPEVEGLDTPNGAEVVAAAATLGLGARIASRCPRRQIAAEVGVEALAQFDRARAAAFASDLRCRAALSTLDSVSERLGTPFVPLKYAALRRSGVLTWGQRPAADTDVLVPEGTCRDLHHALVRDGFVRLSNLEPETHLPTLTRGSDGPIEIHRRIPGVRLPGSVRSLTFADAAAHGYLVRTEDSHWVPSRLILTAHAVVHCPQTTWQSPL